MKRTALKVALAACLSLALTACGGGGSTGSSSSDGTTTIKWAVWNYDKTPEFKALKDGFEKANPTIKVEVVDSLADDYATQVNTRLAAGDTTDVLTMKTMVDYSRLALKNQLVDLTDLATGFPQDSLKGLDAYNLDGKFYSLPYRTDVWVLFYNKDIFDAAGVSYPTEQSWDEFAELAKKLTGTKADGSAQYGTYFHKWASLVQAPAAVQQSKNLYEGNFDYLKAGYERALDLVEAKAMHSQSDITSGNLAYKTEFETGSAAMVPMGTWMIASLVTDHAAGTYTGNWGIAPLPQQSTTDEIATPGGPTGLGVNKNSENQDAAKKFVQYAAGEEGAKILAGVGTAPAYNSQAVTDAYFSTPGMPTDAESKAAFIPDTVGLETPISENSAKLNKILQDEHDLILTGQVDVSQGLSDMSDQITSIGQ